MSFHDLIQKERAVWHDRFIPSMIAAFAVFVITLVLQFSGFDIVLLTSISASIVILTSEKWHRLTVLGTSFYAYLLGYMVGFLFRWVNMQFQPSLAVLSFLTISTITLLIYMVNVFHPPAVGIALGIVLYQGSMANLLFILLVTIVLFIIVKGFMYFYYEHLKWKKFHREFMVWEKKLFK
jgi:hypothetical protein